MSPPGDDWGLVVVVVAIVNLTANLPTCELRAVDVHVRLSGAYQPDDLRELARGRGCGSSDPV